jgi:hypothetical protein
LQTKRVAKDFFNLVVFALAYSDVFLVFTYVYSRYALCLLLQILFVAALDIKTRDVPTVSSINLLLSQYCKASHFFANFYVLGVGAIVRFAPVVPCAKTGPAYMLYGEFYDFYSVSPEYF